MEKTERWQQLLVKIKELRCGGNAALLARKIKRDATYVNRLFYPADKSGAKRIGLQIMTACTEAFELPPGFWDMEPEAAFPGELAAAGETPTSGKVDLSTKAAVNTNDLLSPDELYERVVAHLRDVEKLADSLRKARRPAPTGEQNAAAPGEQISSFTLHESVKSNGNHPSIRQKKAGSGRHRK